jgi:hypothetical protein
VGCHELCWSYLFSTTYDLVSFETWEITHPRGWRTKNTMLAVANTGINPAARNAGP